MTLVYVAIAWMAGIALAKSFPIPWQVWAAGGFLALLVLFLWHNSVRVRQGAICALILTLGAARLLLALPRLGPDSLAYYNDVGRVTLEGVVVGEPDEREGYVNLRVRGERLTLPDGSVREVKGLVLVKADPYPPRHYGDRIRVSGPLETPPVFERFSYQEYLARQGIHSLIRRAQVTLLAERQASPFFYWLFAFKRHARAVLASIIPEPQAALLTGILLGVDTGIPAELMADFSATGTSHIIAISGFNITIISGVFAGLARRLFSRGPGAGEKRALWIAVAGVALYTVLVGASAAVVRAALMGILYLWGRYLERETFAPVSLAAAGIAMTALNPHTLWDVGFQLSFAATIGLILYTRPLEKGLERALTRIISGEKARQVVSMLSEAVLVTLAAQLTTTPIILAYFGRLSLVTLLTNLLILPVQSYVMTTGGVALLTGLVSRPVGQVIGWVAWLFLTYTIEMVRLTARLPFASLPLQVGAATVWGYYALLGGLTWWWSRPRDYREQLWARFMTRVETKVLVGSAVIVLALGVYAWRGLPDGRLHVFFLDVGQGDAILVRTPAGRQMLVDGGPSGTVLLSRLGRVMPFWDRSIDVLVLTHPDADHINGLIPLLERYRVERVVFRPVSEDQATATYRYWLELLEAEGATIHTGEAGLHLVLDNGLDVTVLYPAVEVGHGGQTDFNNSSLVTRLSYGQVSVLLPGDIEAAVEQQLVAQDTSLRSTVLKLPHHGSCSSSSPPFLAAVSPQVVIISVGADNRFGHPCAEVLERLAGIPLYRTDEDGTIEIVSDGAQVWVRTER
ncbi:MAG: DNA internalization-related competence protein ComEC/Rec2 [Anaerolineae bacterium]|nr:DNA internalization-related competence protein ComEC/Rec2 [Anaerolineae bacterium]